MRSRKGSSDGTKKRACIECRQQKMRCSDGSEESGTPCSRCRRQKLSCVYSAPFHRVHKRKRMEELEKEASALRRELQGGSTPPTTVTRTQDTQNYEPTEARSIDGLEIGPPIIDHCFKLFFRDYHPLLPVLDPTITPNLLYGKSLVLFWVIVSIGARKNLAHPNLITALSPRVSPLVLNSLSTRTKPLEVIKAVLLLMEWPFPSNPYQGEPSFILSGALVHMAMQNGLHTPYLGKDIPKLEAQSSFVESSTVERTRLWAYVVIVYQRSCSGCGHPPLLSADAYTDQKQLKTILLQLPTDLQLQLQLSNIMAGAQKIFVQFSSRKLTLQQEQSLDSVLKMVISQLDGLEFTTSSSWEKFQVATCRLDVLAMHFFKTWENLDLQTCQTIFDTVLQVFAFISERETSHKLSSFCPRFVISVVKMGHALMFRLLKGPFASYVDEKLGSSMFLKMINFMKSASLEDGDKVHRAATIVEQMWNVDNMFKDSNGNWDIALRIKHRLSAGVVHEIAIRWREKYLMDRPGGIRQDIAAMPTQTTAIHSSQTRSELEKNNSMDSIDMHAFTDPFTGFQGDFDFDLDNFLDSQFI